jgi:transaldolase
VTSPQLAPSSKLSALHDAGVSIWLDTLSRDLLESGDFAALIHDCSVTGATSNPTIFAKAITTSDRYDDQLRQLASAGEHDTRELFFSLALDDVRGAARLLRREYDCSGGRDGFISCARVAYQRYLKKFAGERWERLVSLGAKRQRPLWASTGTKNPDYSDVLYISELIGPDVVNTTPEATLRAFADHGTVSRTLDREPVAARRTLSATATAGVDLGAITAELEREGLSAFCDSYHQLLACITSNLSITREAVRS